MFKRLTTVMTFYLCFSYCFMPTTCLAVETTKVFPFTVQKFEKAINGKVKAFGTPKWKYVQAKNYGEVVQHTFKITDNVVGDVTASQGKNIKDVMLIFYMTDSNESSFMLFFNSFASAIDVLDPTIQPGERGDVLRELGLLDGKIPTEQTTTKKGDLAFTFAQLPAKQALILLIEPVQ